MSYRYEATIRLIIDADALDSAMHHTRAAAARAGESPEVIEARASILDLHHRPDLDGSLRHRNPTSEPKPHPKGTA